MKRFALLLVALSAAPALAQDGAAASANPVMGSLRPAYAQIRDNLVATAELVPETEYGFKPTPEVRSFGQLIGHVANAQFAICAAALGERSPATQNYEQTTDKAGLVAALRASNEVCDRAYAMTDEATLQMAQVFGRERTRLSALLMNTSHNWEHYGNLVTYMRLKGIVPPTSQGG
jgi:uncharacterized damage-inducible protein DinB